MSKKEKIENLESNENIDLSETIDSVDEFDLSVLKSDIENAEREAKNAINQKIIDQANFQKETENVQQEIEKIQTFKESVMEALEFLFSFVNRKLEKMDVSKFDSEFIEQFTEKFLKIIPKDQMSNVEEFLGAGDKSKASLQIFRVVKFLMFLSKEIYKRIDEYAIYRETHEKQPLKMSFKKNKTEV
ncbi:MAG: hypothetical protein ACTSQJ_06090 [Promethearchaeota archaeon]